jgi:uncharacterized delta-60 repeat protein
MNGILRLIVACVALASAVPALAAPGDLDPTFGVDGVAAIGGPEPTLGGPATALAVQADGKILIAGDTYARDLRIARLDGSGSPDPGFGGDGFVTVDVGAFDSSRDVAVRADGSIVLAGTIGGGPTLDWGVLFLSSAGGELARGTLDTGGHDELEAIALQPDGKVVAVGWLLHGSRSGVARFNAEGSLDTAFNGGAPAYDPDPSLVLSAVAVQPDGKIVATGERAGDFLLVRLDPDGSADSTFGVAGLVTRDLGGNDVATALVLQADGKIVVGGRRDGDFALARFHPSGALDTSFDSGSVAFDLGGFDRIEALALGPAGTIVAAGGTGSQYALMRLTPSGAPDASFGGGDGIAVGDLVPGFCSCPTGLTDIVIDAGGNIVAAGYGEVPDGAFWVAARFLGGGSAPGNTPAGTNVSVSPVDPTTGGTPVTITFASVTAAGDTTVHSSNAGPPAPPNFQLSSVYYDISTTAAYDPPVRICIESADPAARLFHYEGGAWVDVTSDTAPPEVCGRVSSLSPFALLVPDAPAGASFRAQLEQLRSELAALALTGQQAKVRRHSAVEFLDKALAPAGWTADGRPKTNDDGRAALLQIRQSVQYLRTPNAELAAASAAIQTELSEVIRTIAEERYAEVSTAPGASASRLVQARSALDLAASHPGTIDALYEAINARSVLKNQPPQQTV